jgi:hypothetical protein
MRKKPGQHLTLVERRLVDQGMVIANRVWGEDFHKTFSHSLLCSVNLPYRNPGDDVRQVTTSSGAVSLLLEAGHLPQKDGTWKPIGLPYGARARLLLLHLCSEAVKQRSAVVEVTDSFTAFAKELGLSISGQSLKGLRDQIQRMSVVKMSLSVRGRGDTATIFQKHLFEKLEGQFPRMPNQRTFWPSTVEFHPEFFASLQKHAVPMDTAAIAGLKHSARALDIYCWLTNRLHKIDNRRPVRIKWTSLRWQFGNRSQAMKPFKTRFKQALEQVLLVYPGADVRVVYGGLELRYSEPPVDYKQKGLLA